MALTPESPPRITFPGMDPVEKFEFYFRRHPIRLWRSIAIMIMWTGFFAALAYVSDVRAMEDAMMARITIIALCFFLIIPQLAFVIRVYAYHLKVVVVTDRKIHQIKRTLLTVDRHEIVDLATLQDINKSQRGIIQNLFGFGTLRLDAQSSQIRIHFTPRINETYERIVALRENARKRQIIPPPPPAPQPLPGAPA